MKCILCDSDAYVYVEIKKVGIAFCRVHSKNVIDNLENAEKIIWLHNEKRKIEIIEAEQWLGSRPEKFF